MERVATERRHFPIFTEIGHVRVYFIFATTYITLRVGIVCTNLK